MFEGLAPAAQRRLWAMLTAGDAGTPAQARDAIVVCHSEPGAWALPQPLYQTKQCPPVPLREAAYVVARAMFESDGLSPTHVHR